MKPHKIVDKRIKLINENGEEVLFNFPVDAREALSLKDENGVSRYHVPGSKDLTEEVEKVSEVKEIPDVKVKGRRMKSLDKDEETGGIEEK